MEWLWIIAGIIWLGFMLCKESSVKEAPKGTDFIKANNDFYSGRHSIKEVQKKIQNGDYVNKK